MKKTWASITQLSRALVDVTPSKLKKDATIVMNSIIAMDNIYKANSYNLLKMAKIPAVRLALEDIFVDLTLADASSRFSSFRITNCGE